MARPKLPSAIKDLKGTDRPDRINRDEPKPLAADAESLAADAPSFLTERAARYWPELVSLTTGMKVLTVADGFGLAELCEALAELHEARESLNKPLVATVTDRETREPKEIEIAPAGSRSYASFGKEGIMFRPRPEVARINEAFRRFAMMAAKFGLTPADRSRVAAAPGEEKNPFADL